MMKKTAQQSLLDLLMRMMPELQDGTGAPMVFMIKRPATVDKKAVKTLLNLWKDEDNTLAYRKLKRPSDISMAEIDLMVKEKLIKDNGSELEITAKGVDVIKTTILGDERSAYEDDGKPLDYEVALANTKPKRKMLKGAKKASVNEKSAGGNWYLRHVKAGSSEMLQEAMNMLVTWGTRNVGQVTHIVAWCQNATKEAPPADNNYLVRAHAIAVKVAKAQSLDEIKALAKEAQNIG